MKKLADGVKNVNYEPSEGELFIADYLYYERIKFKQEVPIVNLRNDSKSHRRADFYLPKYKTYVEFYGRWNNTKEDRERYREKKKVFSDNKIPCVYLYPENLGIIEFSFPLRLEAEMKKYGLKKELFRYRFKRLFQEIRDNVLGLIFFSFLLFYPTWNWEEDQILIYIFSALVVYQLFVIVREAIHVYK